MISITNVLLTVEALRLGKRNGLDPFKLTSVLSGSTGLNFLNKDWNSARATFEFYVQDLDRCRGFIDILRKDLGHAQELAENSDVSCPFLDQIVKTLQHLSPNALREQWLSVI
jgi:3-hydroxyisobutyrate dehydrogenase-like beta-hydroxyacid dehydrogenase